MVALSHLIVASLAGVGQAIPATATPPKPHVLQLNLEEFQSWAANGTQALDPPALTKVGKRGDIIGGVDNRYPHPSRDFPYSAIARVKVTHPNGYWSFCSGVLVGPRLLATSRSCVREDLASALVSPGYNRGDVFPTSYATGVVSLAPVSGDCDNANGWALLVLDQPLGTQRGFFKTGSYVADESILSGKNIMFSAGYPYDLADGEVVYMSDSRTTSLGIKSRCDNGGPILGDVDNSTQEDGGPLWRLDGSTRVVYGVMMGTLFSDGGAQVSLHAGGTTFFQAVNQMNSQYPK